MTLQKEVLGDSRYVPVLDHGFVGLVDHMGTDNSIVQAARVSYGDGTKTVMEDRGLIRYLVRHKHTSPLEMCDVKLHLKLPIFVMRQLVRHRTSSLNEYSGRYSVMTDEFYVPELGNIKPQSTNNKQGRAGEYTDDVSLEIQSLMRDSNAAAYKVYETLIDDPRVLSEGEAEYNVAREIARTVLPVSNYTELYWKQNLHNLFHMLRLRIDSHAQWEIQEYARAIYGIIQPLFPVACEAFEDYIKESATFSRMEMNLLRDIVMTYDGSIGGFIADKMSHEGITETEFAKKYGMTKRELTELMSRF